MSLKWFVSPMGLDNQPQSQAELLANWNDGKPFRIYQSGGVPVTVNDIVRMKMAGVTCVHFVYQLRDNSVHNYEMELP